MFLQFISFKEQFYLPDFIFSVFNFDRKYILFNHSKHKITMKNSKLSVKAVNEVYLILNWRFFGFQIQGKGAESWSWPRPLQASCC